MRVSIAAISALAFVSSACETKGSPRAADARAAVAPKAPASPTVPAAPAADAAAAVVSDGDLTADQVRNLRSKLDCSRSPQSYFCDALDRFIAGGYPAAVPRAFYPGLSLIANLTVSPGKITEEASYLITLAGDHARYDTIIPETPDEERQSADYVAYFHTGDVPPATDPVVEFCHHLSTDKVVPSRRDGASLRFERPLENIGGENHIYVRETPDALIAVEVAPNDAALFFVGVFPKALQIAPE